MGECSLSFMSTLSKKSFTFTFRAFSRRFYPKRLTISIFVVRSATIYRYRYSKDVHRSTDNRQGNLFPVYSSDTTVICVSSTVEDTQITKAKQTTYQVTSFNELHSICPMHCMQKKQLSVVLWRHVLMQWRTDISKALRLAHEQQWQICTFEQGSKAYIQQLLYRGTIITE